MFLGGLISLAGWPLDMPRLTDWFNTGISIQPNTAVAAMSSGVALFLLVAGYPRASAVAGVLIALLGVTALVQFILGVDFGQLNTALMFGREWGRGGTVAPGRMGPPSATCWTLIGTTFVASGFTGARQLIPRVGTATLAIAALSVAGYFYGVDRLFALPYLTAVALQTATFIAVVSAGMIAAVPERTPMRWFLDQGAAGAVARRGVPLIIFIPFFAGWLRLWGERTGLYDTSFGVTILVLVLIILLLAVLSWTLRTISMHESALRDSRERITATLESITDGFVTLDRDWRYVFVNAEGARLLERARDELLGRSAWDVFPQAVNSRSWRELHRAAEGRVSVEFEDFNPQLQRWFANRAYPTSDGAITVYFQDITARKQAEVERAADLAGISRLQALSTQLVQSGEMHSLLRELLAAAAELTGTTKGNIQFCDAESNNLRMFVHQGHGERFLAHFSSRGSPAGCDQAARTVSRVVVSDITRHPDWQGTEDQLVLLEDGIRAFQSTPLVSRAGRLVGVLNTHFPTAHEINDREKRHLDLLARMAADFIERVESDTALKNADRMKDEFLAMLAHELRNPLAPVLNGVALLRLTGGNDETIRSTTAMLERQVSQLVRLVDDLVDVSRITRGKIELNREPLELAAVLQQALEAARPLVEAKNQHVDVTPAAGPIHVNADFTRLTQVVGNLLSNASKFTPHNGKIALTVETSGESVSIRVRDEGVGITREQLPRIFDLFMQGDTSLERSVSGLGIGLTLVKTLVEMHGGTVDAHSDGPGKGSEFVVRLPVIAATHGAVAAPSSNGSELPRTRRVLIVDDNVDGASSLAHVLSLSGHATETAHDGQEAVIKAERFRPDVVLLDIGLPSLNGYEACRRIREQPWGKDMMLVALTGWGAETYRQRSTEAGFDLHVVKPVDSETLMQLLQRNS